ncbi:hypothetical protein FRB94_007673 [Tulasnella sp. JGI-2019a]|nr:hypothetical protein FRB94_007673 [Tulasnella sp. JGI-2019a]
MGCCTSRGHDPSPNAHSGIPSESIGSRDESRIRSNMSNTQNPSNTNDREMSLASRNHAGPSIQTPESQKVDKEDIGRKDTTGSSQPRPPMDGNVDFTPRSRRGSTATVASTKSRRKARPKSSYVPSKPDDMAGASTSRDRTRSVANTATLLLTLLGVSLPR